MTKNALDKLFNVKRQHLRQGILEAPLLFLKNTEEKPTKSQMTEISRRGEEREREIRHL